MSVRASLVYFLLQVRTSRVVAVTTRRSERASRFRWPLHLRWSMQTGTSHDLRPGTRNASGGPSMADPARTFSTLRQASPQLGIPLRNSRGLPISAVIRCRSPCKAALVFERRYIRTLQSAQVCGIKWGMCDHCAKFEASCYLPP